MKPKIILALLLLVPGASLVSCARGLAVAPLRAGVEAADAERWDEAVQYWTKAVALDPNSAAAHNNLAIAAERQGDWTTAAKEYDIAVRLDPENARIRANYESFKARLEAGGKKRP
jgi:Tfp pilus assembly protein PilF